MKIFILIISLINFGCNLITGKSEDNKNNSLYALGVLAASNSSSSCTTNACKTTCLGSTITTTSIDSDMPSWISNNFACVKAYKGTESGVDYYVFETEDVPPHKSPYWGSASANYESMPAGNTQLISNFLSQNYKFKIRVTPTVASGGSATARELQQVLRLTVLFYFLGRQVLEIV